jgi:hypothetical protein
VASRVHGGRLRWLYVDKILDVQRHLCIRTSNTRVEKQETRVRSTLDHQSRVHLTLYSEDGSRMVMGMIGFLGSCAPSTNIGIARQPILDYLGGERINSLEDQAHRSGV